MKPAREICRAIVARYSGKRGYPQFDEGLTELINAFQRFCVDDRHASAVAEELQIDTDYCPQPSEIRRVALATRPERKPNACKVCGGTGFHEKTIARRRIAAIGNEQARTATCVEPCPNCRPGGFSD
jgi:hypothetical protein